MSSLIARIQSACTEARRSVGSKVAASGEDRIAESYLDDVAPEDLQARAPEDVAAAIDAHLRLAGRRQPGEINVSVLAPDLVRDGWRSANSIAQVVTDDMPFLVDSVTMAIRAAGLGIELVIHPILRVERDGNGDLVSIAALNEETPGPGSAESFIHVEFDRETTAADLTDLERSIRDALADVAAATADWSAMRVRAVEMAGQLRARGQTEEAELLDWITHNHFTFLGAADYDESADGTLVVRPGSLLGILTREPQRFLRPSTVEGFLVTKTDRAATVHRAVPCDVIGMANERVHRRIVGLFSSEAYFSSPLSIPLVRTKVAAVLEAHDLDARSHSGRALRSTIETLPRDTLFALSTEELHELVQGVLQVHERRRVRLFARFDVHRRAWTCLVYLPRDRYTTEVRERVQALLLSAFGGARLEFSTSVSESGYARLAFVIPLEDGARPAEVDVSSVEARVVDAVRSWSESLRLLLQERLGEEAGRELHQRYGGAFPASYTAAVGPGPGAADVLRIEQALVTGRMTIDVRTGEPARLGLYSLDTELALADLLPVLDNLGTRVIDERANSMTVDGRAVWIHTLGVTATGLTDDSAAAARLASAFEAVWTGQADNDGFNRLVLAAGLSWKDVVVVRAYARYLRQLGATYSLAYVESTLLAHAETTTLLIQLFRTRFDPDLPVASVDERTAACESLIATITGRLDAIPSLDHDRILRSLLGLIGATTRTTAYQTAPAALALKLEPRRIPDAPSPRPRFEIFVCSPRVEGLHLRMDAVARGGIRWSDRPEDFRTEILGLMKAQAVKNAVIVPAGAKGGFVVRRGDTAVDCYRTFIAALLDLTDNRVGGAVVAPERTVRYDGDDPYLVVAADKGTATFSDVANEISLARGFWLGDAFASGGSAGYDHKKMGITAKGAWESVKTHFRRLGRSLEQPFTVAGIGDMSGDVFGNGMLLSDQIRLVAAFDHRHVFIDPQPADTLRSFAERRRLFELPRSSWDDYDRALLSPGGGVWPRSAKSIPLSADARAALGLEELVEQLTPNELISAVLKAPVDLLWNGGIGTYVKASYETHAAAGDRTNDALRVNGLDLRCKVVAEGGNLGFTQRGRIEFAQAGGLVNTDAIDNSAGVDTSDHEVNLKILVGDALVSGKMTRTQRDELFAAVQEDVAALVLADNTAQNRVLVNGLAQSPSLVGPHTRYIAYLERDARLDRELEAIPGSEALAARRANGGGLVIPELAVLLAYTKLHLTEQLLEGTACDDDAFADCLYAYFPERVREQCADLIVRHPLRRELIATSIVNRIVNMNGITFVFRMQEETHADVADVLRAQVAAVAIHGIDRFWADVCALDGALPIALQTELFLEADRLVERCTRWLLHNRRLPVDIAATIGALSDPVARVAKLVPSVAAGVDAAGIGERRLRFGEGGVPDELAAFASTLELLPATLEIARIAEHGGWSLEDVTAVHFAVADHLAFGELRQSIQSLPRDDQWGALARIALRDDLASEHAALTRAVLTSTARGDGDRLGAWMVGHASAVERHLELVSQVHESKVSLAPLSFVLRQLRLLSSDRGG